MPALFAPQDYQPALAARHAEVVARLRPRWPGARFEAIGASSIPGAVSKGDLDLLMAVPGVELAACVPRLEAQGYRVKADTLRTPELCMLEHPQPEHALQLVAQGSAVEGTFLNFRDRLRAEPRLVAAYNQVKHAQQGADDAGYRAAKALFIAAVQAARDAAEALRFAEVLAHEQRVWAALQAGDAVADQTLLRPDFLGVYPAGLCDRAGHAEGLSPATPRVLGFGLHEPVFRSVDAGAVLLSYRAEFRTAAVDLLAMRVSSLWTCADVAAGHWRNLFSQDTPL